MFKPEQVIHHHQHFNSKTILPKEFGILSWNAQKKSNLIRFKQNLSILQRKYFTNLILLQEAREIEQEQNNHLLSDFDKIYSANLQMKKRSYGLLTASSATHSKAASILSHHKEPFIKTHKNILISSYTLHNKKKLFVVNIHAINFKSTKAYSHEINTLVSFLSNHQGPLIVAGDFNSWNKKRNLILLDTLKILHLKKVLFLNEQNIKKFRQFTLDHIFYRDLKLLNAEALNCNKISDHNPLYSLFKTI